MFEGPQHMIGFGSSPWLNKPCLGTEVCFIVTTIHGFASDPPLFDGLNTIPNRQWNIIQFCYVGRHVDFHPFQTLLFGPSNFQGRVSSALGLSSTSFRYECLLTSSI